MSSTSSTHRIWLRTTPVGELRPRGTRARSDGRSKVDRCCRAGRQIQSRSGLRESELSSPSSGPASETDSLQQVFVDWRYISISLIEKSPGSESLSPDFNNQHENRQERYD